MVALKNYCSFIFINYCLSLYILSILVNFVNMSVLIPMIFCEGNLLCTLLLY